MAIHIGNIIHEIAKQKGIKTKVLAAAINVSESNIYKIYARPSLDIEKLISLSKLFGVNLFENYMKDEFISNAFNQKIVDLQATIDNQQQTIIRKEEYISELERLNLVLKQRLQLLEGK